jgi:uncharacterized protein
MTATTSERSCAACRRRAPRESLLRCVADPAGRLRVDPLQRAPGRGVYLCPDPACVGAACRRGALAHGLRRRLQPLAAEQLQRAALEAVRLAASAAAGQGLADGRLRRSGDETTVVDDSLGRRLRILAEQAKRLEASADPKRAGGERP